MTNPERPLKKRKNRFWTLFFLSFLALLGILVYDVLALTQFFSKAEQNRFTLQGNVVHTDSWNGKERMNILLLGVDNRAKDLQPRSDTIMIFSIDPSTKQAFIFSILRDTYVTIPGLGKDKINAAFANGGPDLAMKTIRDFLQIPIHHYMITDFQGFEGLVNAVGGIDLSVEKDLNYADDGVYDIHLKAGQQHLDGKKALMYVRFRADAMSDFARTERQRKLLSALAKEIETPLTLIRFPNMAKAAAPYVQTDMGIWDSLTLAPLLMGMNAANISTSQVPPMQFLTEANTPQGEAILKPDIASVRAYVQEKFKGSAMKPKQVDSNAPVPASKNVGRAVVTGEYANVREAPNTQSKVLTQVQFGDVVTVLSQEPEWSRIQLTDGTIGYIANFLIQIQ